jgi:hypothetical protein
LEETSDGVEEEEVDEGCREGGALVPFAFGL